MTVIVSALEFDAEAKPVIVSFVTFDTLSTVPAGDYVPTPPAARAGMGYRRASTIASSVQSPPSKAANRYHWDSQEQEIAAAELQDEEIVLTFLMEFALHV